MANRTDVLFPQLVKRRNRAAIERTLRALRAADRTDPVDSALIAAVRSSAAALDDAPSPYVAATVLRVHLVAIQLLTGKPAPEPDEIDAWLRSLRPTSSAGPVRDGPES
jgi:hypothetical protein